MNIYNCFLPDYEFESCEVSDCQEQSVIVNALFEPAEADSPKM